MKVLIVEDHRPLQALLVDHLKRGAFAVDAVQTGEDALLALKTTRYDALLLDLGLPDMDGMKVLACNADRSSPVPCIVLTARDALQSRVDSLNAGADDYVLKPFDMPELEARLRAVLRRSAHVFHTLTHGNLSFEPEACHVVVAGRTVNLARREAMLLEEMLRAGPRIVVKDRLEERLYSYSESVTSNAIEALVSRLRRKFSDAGADSRIETVRGVGYRLVSAHEAHAQP